jgi:hypothetical protein
VGFHRVFVFVFLHWPFCTAFSFLTLVHSHFQGETHLAGRLVYGGGTMSGAMRMARQNVSAVIEAAISDGT